MIYDTYPMSKFDDLVSIFGTYSPTNNPSFSQGFSGAMNSYTNKASATILYGSQRASTAFQIPMPRNLVGYSSVITIPAGSTAAISGNLFDKDGNAGIIFADGIYSIFIEIESTNASVGNFNKATYTPLFLSIQPLHPSPNLTANSGNYYGSHITKEHLPLASPFLTTAEGGMSTYLPPQTISDNDLVAIFGSVNTTYPEGTGTRTCAMDAWVVNFI